MLKRKSVKLLCHDAFGERSIAAGPHDRPTTDWLTACLSPFLRVLGPVGTAPSVTRPVGGDLNRLSLFSVISVFSVVNNPGGKLASPAAYAMYLPRGV